MGATRSRPTPGVAPPCPHPFGGAGGCPGVVQFPMLHPAPLTHPPVTELMWGPLHPSWRIDLPPLSSSAIPHPQLSHLPIQIFMVLLIYTILQAGCFCVKNLWRLLVAFRFGWWLFSSLTQLDRFGCCFIPPFPPTSPWLTFTLLLYQLLSPRPFYKEGKHARTLNYLYSSLHMKIRLSLSIILNTGLVRLVQ